MATKTTPAKSSKKPTPRKPAPTAEERRAQREAVRIAREAEELRVAAEFDSKRAQVFKDLMFKAMLLEMQAARYSALREQYEWWFDDFRVDVFAMAIHTDAVDGPAVSEATLERGVAQRIDDGLEMALEWVINHIADLERQRLEAEALARKRTEALAKLSVEDQRVLGLLR